MSSHQHHDPGLGHGIASRGRCQAARSRRGWSAPAQGRQLAVDNVGWVLHANGQPMRRTPDEDGVRLVVLVAEKKGSTPNRATLVVLAGEVGGRWSGLS